MQTHEFLAMLAKHLQGTANTVLPGGHQIVDAQCSEGHSRSTEIVITTETPAGENHQEWVISDRDVNVLS